MHGVRRAPRRLEAAPGPLAMTRRLHDRPLRPAALLALAACPALAAAQTGPFRDGELLLRPAEGGALGNALYRVDPATGQAAELVGGLIHNYSDGGWLAYEPHRDALLAYTAWVPTGISSPRLFVVQSDGTMVDAGYHGEDLHAFAPVGDGRVYLQRGGVLHVLDAANVATPVLDAATGQPLDLPFDHLLHDAEQNVLVATGRSDQLPCAAFKHVHVYRVPLSPDGLEVAGPITCNNFDFAPSVGYPVGLDLLPGGDVLLTVTGQSNSGGKHFLRVDAATLAISVWAESDFNDFDGGVWAQSIGRVVARDDKENTLRLYDAGGSGEGALLVTSLPMTDNTTGISSANKLADVELWGGGCAGSATPFGVGLPGAGALAPILGAAGCPRIGGVVPLTVASGVGGGVGAVVLGVDSAAFPLFGGTFYVLPPFAATLPFGLSGAAGAPGAGFAQLALNVPNNPALFGVPIFGQAAVVDLAAPEWIALTPGLRLLFG